MNIKKIQGGKFLQFIAVTHEEQKMLEYCSLNLQEGDEINIRARWNNKDGSLDSLSFLAETYKQKIVTGRGFASFSTDEIFIELSVRPSLDSDRQLLIDLISECVPEKGLIYKECTQVEDVWTLSGQIFVPKLHAGVKARELVPVQGWLWDLLDEKDLASITHIKFE